MPQFVNILTKNDYRSDLLWISRYISFAKAYLHLDRAPLNHEEIKEEVLMSDSLKAIENLELVDRTRFQAEARQILNEIGYARSVATIRWLSFPLIKMVRKTLDGIYVNEDQLLKLKSSMGDCPVVFVPTHRSYSDFILLAFLCFVYEIEIPCVAAGIDFLSMWLMSDILRKCKAFYIRRTFKDNKLYKAIFGLYVATVLSKGDSPMEFFIEGTRSRTGKSLKPKYGFLTMLLQPFITGEVPDIKFVPVSISYDRYLEERLYSQELLGTPKPKESTKGMFKAFTVLNQNYGNVYFNYGEPISVHKWISRNSNSIVARPLASDVKQLASLIIQSHIQLQVVGGFNLFMVALYDEMISTGVEEVPLSSLDHKFQVVLSVMSACGINVLLTKENVVKEIEYACTINPRLIMLKDGVVHMLGNDVNEDVEQANTTSLNNRLVLHLYVNSVAAIMFCPSILLTLIASNFGTCDDKELSRIYAFLCELYESEFPIGCSERPQKYLHSMSLLKDLKCIYVCDSSKKFMLSTNTEVIHLLQSIIVPYLLGYSLISQYLLQIADGSSFQSIKNECQVYLKQLFRDGHLKFPICMTTSFILTCLSSFKKIGVLKQNKKELSHMVNQDGMKDMYSLLNSLSIAHKNKNSLKTKL